MSTSRKLKYHRVHRQAVAGTEALQNHTHTPRLDPFRTQAMQQTHRRRAFVGGIGSRWDHHESSLLGQGQRRFVGPA